MKKFFLLMFSLLIMISAGAVGNKSTDVEKTEYVSYEKETLSCIYLVMDLSVYDRHRFLCLSDSTLIVISIVEPRNIKKNLHTLRLDKRIDPGRNHDVIL